VELVLQHCDVYIICTVCTRNSGPYRTQDQLQALKSKQCTATMKLMSPVPHQRSPFSATKSIGIVTDNRQHSRPGPSYWQAASV